MELTQVIADSLIREVDKTTTAWKPFVQSHPDVAAELQQLATREPTNTADFLRFLFASRNRLSESLLVSVLPESLRPRVIDLIDRRSNVVEQKERLVRSGDYLQAAKALCIQQSLISEINDQLAGQNLMLTIKTMTDAIQRIGWPKSRESN